MNNVDNNQINAYSAIPIVGQVIGTYTVALNILKATQAAGDVVYAWAAKKPVIHRVEAKERFIYHAKWVGVGIIRVALPIIGGATLWAMDAVPLKEYQFTLTREGGKAQKIFHRVRAQANKDDKELYLISSIPFFGQAGILGSSFANLSIACIHAASLTSLKMQGLFYKHKKNLEGEKEAKRALKEYLTNFGKLCIGLIPVVGGLTLYALSAGNPYRQFGEKEGEQKLAQSLAQNGTISEATHHSRVEAGEKRLAEVETVSRLPQKEAAVLLQNPQKRLALLLGDTQVGNSQYEGGLAADAVHFWKGVVEDKKRNLDVDLTQEERSSILADFEDAAKTENMLDLGLHADFVNYLCEGLERRGRVVLTLTVNGAPGGSGHVAGAVLERKGKGPISFYFINQGGGSGDYPMVSLNGKPYRSYRSFKRILDPRLFTGENPKFDQNFADKLSQFARFSPRKGEWNFYDLQGLFYAVSKPDPADKIKSSDAVTTQRGGTCSEKFARLIMRDQLLKRGKASLQLLKYKRQILSGKLEGVKHLMKMNDPYPLIMRLGNSAAHSFVKALENKVITQEEFAFALELIKGIDCPKPPLGTALPEIEQAAANLVIMRYQPYEKYPHAMEGLCQKTRENYKDPSSVPIESVFRSDTPIEFHQAVMRTLPIPTPNQANPLWDNLSEQPKLDLINYFANLQIDLKESEQVLFHLQSMAIIDYLIRSTPSLKMEGFRIQPILKGMQHKLDLSYGDTAVRFEQLLHYFETQSPNDKDLFSFINLTNEEFQAEFDACIEGKFHKVQHQEVHALFEYLGRFKDKIKDLHSDTEKELFYRLLATEQMRIPFVEIDGEFKPKRPKLEEKNYLPETFRALTTLMSHHYKLMLPRQKDDSENDFTLGNILVGFDHYINDDTYRNFSFNGLRKTSISQDQTVKPKGKYFKNDPTLEKKENLLYQESSLPVSCAFSQFDAYGNLRIPYLIQWINQHPFKSEEEFEEIMIGFFRDHALLNALRKEPALRENIEEMIRSKLSSLNPNSHKEALAWIKLGFFCQTQADQARVGFNSEFIEQVKVFIYRKIEKIEDDKLLKEYFECLAHLSLYPEGQTAELLTHLCCARFYGSNQGLELQIRELFQKPNFHDVLEQNREQIGRTILKRLKIEAPEGEWESRFYPYLTLRDATGSKIVQIDIEAGEIVHLGKKLRGPYWPSWVNMDQIAELGISKESKIVVSENRVIASDGSFELVYKNNGVEIYKKFPFADELLLLDRLNYDHPLFKKRRLWIGKEQAFLLEYNGTLAATLSNGEVQNSKEEYLAQGVTFLSQSSSEVLYWGKKEGWYNPTIKITSMECRDLGLCFTKQDAGWESEQHKGFVLSQRQGYLDGVNFPGALQLEKIGDPSVKKLILPAKVITREHPLDRTTYFSEEMLNKDFGYFEYDLIEKSDHFYSEDPAALLYLSYVYQSLGEYTLAVHYLNLLPQKGIIPLSLRIIELMDLHKDTSPEALAFLCKVVLRGLEEDQLNLDHLFSNQSTIEFYINFDGVFEKLTLYSHLDSDALPEGLRISQEEQKKLLLFLQSKKKGTGHGLQSKAYALSHQPLPPLLQNQPSEDPIFLSFLEDLKWGLSYFVPARTSAPFEGKINLNFNDHGFQFSSLFLSAINCQSETSYKGSEVALLKRKERIGAHPFDLDLQILWQSGKTNDSSKAIVQVLYLVRHYPECFRHLSLGDENFSKNLLDVAKNLYASLNKAYQMSQNELSPAPFTERKKEGQQKTSLHFPAPPPEKPHKPCQKLVGTFFTSEEQDVFNTSFALGGLEAKSSLAGKIYEKLKSAFQTLKKLKVEVFQLKEKGLADAIKAEIAEQKRVLKLLEARIEKAVNKKGTDSPQKQMDLLQKGKREITLQEVMLAVGTNNPSLLTDNNPMIDQKTLDLLYIQAIKWMKGASRLDQLKEAGKSGSAQEAAVILNKTRNYDVNKWPELLFYEYSTGLMLRSDPDQAKLLIDMFTHLFEGNQSEFKRLCFEFQAGGGKTKVLSAILAAKAMRQGKIPVFFSLPALFDVVKQDLREVIAQVFEKNVVHLNIDLQHTFDATAMRELNHALQNRKSQGLCMVFTPETYHSLHLAWQRALRDNNLGLIQEIGSLLELLKQEGLFLIDETHRNVDSLLQSNKAEGVPEAISEEQREIIIQTYQLLSGQGEQLVLSNGKTVKETLRLTENKQAQVSEEEKKECLELVIDRLLQTIQIPAQLRKEATKFVKENSAPCPSALPSFLQEELALIRGLYQKILPANLAKVGEMDYGASINPSDLVEAPRDQKTATTAKFESADISATLTCQGAFQRGVENLDGMKQLLIQMQEEAKEVRSFEVGELEIFKKFKAWQKENPIELEEITEENLNNPLFLKKLIEKIGKEPELIIRYLRYIALPRVLHYPEKMNSTGADLVAAGSAVVQFSATLGVEELYPLGLKEEFPYWLDPEFLANVAHRCCMPHNRNHHYLEPSSPKDLFQNLFNENPGYFDTLEGIIDLGYWSKGHSSKSVAESFCTFAQEKALDFAGAIYFDIDEKNEKRLYVLPIGKKEAIPLHSTNLKRELAKLGLENKRFFKIYAPDETTGTDLTLSNQAKMIVSIGENTTLSTAAQAVMRMRNFLKNPIKKGEVQSTLFVLPNKVRPLIEESQGRNDVVGLFGWLTENEAKKLKSTIIANAIQDIHFLARNYVKEIIRNTPLKKKHQVYKTHSRCFEFPVPRDLMRMYGGEMQEIDTHTFLENFKNTFFASSKLTEDQQRELEANALRIIQRASALVQKCESPQHNFNSTARQTGYQTTVEEVKQRALENQRVSGTAQSLLDYAKNEDHLSKLDLSSSKNYSLFSSLHEAPFFPQNLFIAQNALAPFSDREARKQHYSILIVERNGVKQAAVVSNDDAIHYLEQIRKGQYQGAAALFTPDGNLYQNGGLKFDKEERWFKEVMAAVNLSNGLIQDKETIERWVASYPEQLRELWNELKASFVFQEGAFDTRALDQIYTKVHPLPLERKEKRKVVVKKDETATAPSTGLPQDPVLQLGDQFGSLQRKIPYHEQLYRNARGFYRKVRDIYSKK